MIPPCSPPPICTACRSTAHSHNTDLQPVTNLSFTATTRHTVCTLVLCVDWLASRLCLLPPGSRAVAAAVGATPNDDACSRVRTRNACRARHQADAAYLLGVRSDSLLFTGAGCVGAFRPQLAVAACHVVIISVASRPQLSAASLRTPFSLVCMLMCSSPFGSLLAGALCGTDLYLPVAPPRAICAHSTRRLRPRSHRKAGRSLAHEFCGPNFVPEQISGSDLHWRAGRSASISPRSTRCPRCASPPPTRGSGMASICGGCTPRG